MKAGSRGQQAPRNQIEEVDGMPKPLAATLLQEFQNLKDKFKNEDDGAEKGERRCNRFVSPRFLLLSVDVLPNTIPFFAPPLPPTPPRCT
jgi:hypothetical protein